MNNLNKMKNIYDDFFGNSLPKSEDIIKIEKLNDGKKSFEEDTKDLSQDFEILINNLFIDDSSKEILTKIVRYMKNYHESLEKDYIKFNVVLVSADEETVNKVSYIISKASQVYSYVDTGEDISKSLYNIKEIGELDEIYNKYSTILVKNLERLNLISDVEFKQKLIYKLNEKSSNINYKKITIISCDTLENLKIIFETDNNLKSNFSNFMIKGERPDVQDVYQAIIYKLGQNNELSDDFKVKLLDYISQTFDNSKMSFSIYRDKLCNQILFNLFLNTF